MSIDVMDAAVIDPAVVHAQRDRAWAAANALTRSTRQVVQRDSGGTEWAIVPSLLDQAHEALRGSAISGAASGPSSAERAPLDLSLFIVVERITTVTRLALLRRKQTPRPSVSEQVRQLVSYGVRSEPDRLKRYADVIGEWASMLIEYLRSGEPTGTSTRLRGSACPACGARQVSVHSEDGTTIAPPLLVEVRDGMVRSAVCSSCRRAWWRGQELLDLARLLGCTPID